MKAQRVAVLAVIVALALMALWWRATQGDSPSSASLRLAWIPGATFAGDYAAQNNNSWDKRGLAIAINPGGFEHDAIKLVATGVDTFGVSSGPQVLQARASGVPVVAIGAVIPRSPIGWVAKKESGIRGPRDFVGRRVGAQLGTHTELTLEALCATVGVDLTKVTRIPVKFDPRPFVAGEIDVLPVYLIDQPLDLAAQGLALTLIDPGDYNVSLAYGNVYIASEETLRVRPDLVRRFLEGAAEGWQWAYAHRTEAVEILQRVAPESSTPILSAKLNATFDFVMKGRSRYDGVFAMTQQDWARTAELLRMHGNGNVTLDVSKCYDNSYVPR